MWESTNQSIKYQSILMSWTCMVVEIVKKDSEFKQNTQNPDEDR